MELLNNSELDKDAIILQKEKEIQRLKESIFHLREATRHSIALFKKDRLTTIELIRSLERTVFILGLLKK